MNKDELLEISKNFFGSVFQVENVSEKIRNLTYREVKKVFSAYDPRDLDCIVYPYEVLFTLIFHLWPGAKPKISLIFGNSTSNTSRIFFLSFMVVYQAPQLSQERVI